MEAVNERSITMLKYKQNLVSSWSRKSGVRDQEGSFCGLGPEEIGKRTTEQSLGVLWTL